MKLLLIYIERYEKIQERLSPKSVQKGKKCFLNEAIFSFFLDRFYRDKFSWTSSYTGKVICVVCEYVLNTFSHYIT